MPKLTDTFCRQAAKEPDKPQSRFFDDAVPGFALFVGKRRKTFYYQRDIEGRTRRVMIGHYPIISVQAARQTALELQLKFEKGLGKRAMRQAPTLKDALTAYLEDDSLSKAQRTNVESACRVHLSDWYPRQLTDIEPVEVLQHHAALMQKLSPAMANSVLKNFRTIYNRQRPLFDMPECPTTVIKWPNERRPQQVIRNLKGWHAAVNEIGNPIHSTYYRLLLTTGLRRTECLSLTWDQVRHDHIHFDVTKNGSAFDLPILEEHHKVLARVRPLSDVFVFPAWRGEAGHVRDPQPLFIDGERITHHAHRRTFATVAEEANVSHDRIGRLLNHTPQSLSGNTYSKPSYQALAPAMSEVIAAFKRAVPEII